jgi:hypothetical protein
MQKLKQQKKDLSQQHFACPKSHIEWPVVLVQKSKGKKAFRRPGHFIILKWMLNKWDGMQSGFNWLRKGTSGELLCKQ